MEVIEIMRALEGNENTQIIEYPNGAKLFSGTSQNIPADLQNRHIVTIRLLPQIYLGVALYIA